MCERIQKDPGFTEKITPRRFGTTVLTDLDDKTKDVKIVPTAAGHSTTAMTLKHSGKGRECVAASAGVLDRVYSAQAV